MKKFKILLKIRHGNQQLNPIYYFILKLVNNVLVWFFLLSFDWDLSQQLKLNGTPFASCSPKGGLYLQTEVSTDEQATTPNANQVLIQ